MVAPIFSHKTAYKALKKRQKRLTSNPHLLSKDIYSKGACRVSNGLGDTTHAPLHITPGPHLLFQLTHYVVQKDIPALHSALEETKQILIQSKRP